MNKNRSFFRGLRYCSMFLLTGIISFSSAINASAINLNNGNIITGLFPYYAFFEDEENPWETVWDPLDATDVYYYSDEFFASDSAGEHPELRTVSYALALAGFENTADGSPEHEGDNPNPRLRRLLGQLGFSDYEYWDEVSEENGHSMGTSIARKNLGEQELVVVAPRSYNYMTEWLSNFNVGTEGDHAGFSESAELVAERMRDYISSRNIDNCKIWIVGYSRGGAVMDLVGKKINENLETYKVQSKNLYIYTFGAPRASVTETHYDNIHDVKDGNDLLLGYVFPEQWSFYNTGVLEEIHEADLTIPTSAIDISNIDDSGKMVETIVSGEGITTEIETKNGLGFMNEWTDFISENGLSREYFDQEVKGPLSAIMKAYQMRTIDKQSEFTSFITSQESGILGKVAQNAFVDLFSGGYGQTIEEALANYPLYQDIVKILKGTAVDADIQEVSEYLERFMGNYADYTDPTVSEEEFNVLKNNLPELIRVLGPIIVADARVTRETVGENYSLYYLMSLVDNASSLVYGHVPEDIMPILKSYVSLFSEDTQVQVVESERSEGGVKLAETGDLTSIVNFTSEEQKLRNNGWPTKVFVEARDNSEEVSEEEKVLIKNVVGKDTIVSYFDINFYKQIGADEVEEKVFSQVEELEREANVRIEIPEEDRYPAEGVSREFYVVRLHGGEAKKLPVRLLEDGAGEFSSDKFSTYALAYSDTEVVTEDDGEGDGGVSRPNTGFVTKADTGEVSWGGYVISAGIVGIGLVFACRRQMRKK